MGMQGFYGRPDGCRHVAGQGHHASLYALTFSFFLLPVLAGCSSNSSWSSGSSQSAAVAPPPSQPTYAQTQGRPDYPQAAAAQTSSAPTQYQHVPGYPDQNLFSNSTQPAPSAAADNGQQHVSGYPDQSIADLFRGSTQPQSVPRPPGTYTPSGQPYIPPQGQPTYDAAAPQTVPRPPSTYTPSGQPYSPPGQPGAAPSPGAAPPTPADNEQRVSGYPNQSITDIFH
jgi:hypothetical protein